jgi:hypothetical protein
MTNVFACLAFLPLLVSAIPQVNYPLNLQYPPIARIGEPFSFQFVPTTFSSAPRGLQYSLIGNPPWLSFDDSSRTLSGTPRASDVGTANFTIAVAEQAGAVANMQSQRLIVQGDVPTTKDDISAPFSAAGELSGLDTVTLKPSKPFTISFPSDTFYANGVELSYFALLSDRTPLPAWISFDSSSRTFVGTAPPSDYARSFQIDLIAFEVPGFADASISFTMVVSNHAWLFKPFSSTINVAEGDEVRITGLKQKLFVDESQAGDSDIESATADLPSWLIFNNDTFEIASTAPAELKSQDLIITAKDQSGDVAEYTIHFIAQFELFADEIETLNLTLGQPFEYEVQRAAFTKDGASVTVDLASLAQFYTLTPQHLPFRARYHSTSPLQMFSAPLQQLRKMASERSLKLFTLRSRKPLRLVFNQPPAEPISQRMDPMGARRPS